MNPHSVVVQRSVGPAPQLMLLFHGVGGTPDSMEPLGRRLAAAFPAATIVAVAGRERSDSAAGWQWFSVQGVSEANRAERVAEAMPAFLAEVRGWQQGTEASAAATALIGFSQGAIMALEAATADPALAGRVVALAGRYADVPARAPAQTTLHLIHGKHDAVMPYRHAVESAQHLLAQGGDVTADVLPFVGHELNAEMTELVVQRLCTHVPKRLWDEALRATSTP